MVLMHNMKLTIKGLTNSHGLVKNHSFSFARTIIDNLCWSALPWTKAQQEENWSRGWLSVRGPLPYLHFVGHCPTRAFTFRGPLPYFHISWAIALLPFISWAIALLPLLSWAIALLLRTLILVSVCCKTRLATFVLRGCDSIRIVPVRI